MLLQMRQKTGQLSSEEAMPLLSGSAVFFRVLRTGRRICAEASGLVHAKWDHQGEWERFIVQKDEASDGDAITSGDRVHLRTWTGMYLALEDHSIHATMAYYDEPSFEKVDAGSSHTYPQQCAGLRKGSLVLIRGKPCKIVEMSTSKTGKHGHAKAHIVALDIFTGKKYEDLCPTSHNMEVPFSKRTECQLLGADAVSGAVGLLLESGETKHDLNLPTFASTGEPTDEDKKVSQEILDGQERGDDVFVVVLSACGEEKIIAVKRVEQKN